MHRMSRSYLVQMPRAEARHLAGTGDAALPAPEARCIEAIREWLHGLRGRRPATVPVSKVVADLTLILGIVPPAGRPARGPLAAGHGASPPGQVEYLGSGTVRLDDAAISALAGLREGDDFRVTITDAGPVLTVGGDRYLARPEDPGRTP